MEAILQDARVIALGEPEHGLHEFLAFRNRLVEYLVEAKGVTAIAAQTGYTESVAADRYVLGEGEASDPPAAAVFSWSGDAAYPENRDLLVWLRAYNARAARSRKVRFYGIDLSGGRDGRFSQARIAIDTALTYVVDVDTALARAIGRRLSSSLVHFSSSGYDSLTLSQQEALTTPLDDLAAAFDRRQVLWTTRSSGDAFERARHQVLVARQLNQNFRAAPTESNPQAQREAAMARNVAWVLEREGPSGRVLLYATNWHISKGPMVSDRWGSSLGEHLYATLRRDYVALGAAYGRIAGDPADAPADSASVTALLTRAATLPCVLDLGAVPRDGPVSVWFRAERPVRGGRNDRMALDQAFDALVFLAKVRRSVPG
jgi:erythromycin esterase